LTVPGVMYLIYFIYQKTFLSRIDHCEIDSFDIYPL
jgi:hypothetical protein